MNYNEDFWWEAIDEYVISEIMEFESNLNDYTLMDAQIKDSPPTFEFDDEGPYVGSSDTWSLDDCTSDWKAVLSEGSNYDKEELEYKLNFVSGYNVHHDLLVMRPDKFKADSWPIAAGNLATKDMRFMSDDILKKKMLDTFIDINDVFLVVDDRNKAVNMWRDLGLNTFQVAPGDF